MRMKLIWAKTERYWFWLFYMPALVSHYNYFRLFGGIYYMKHISVNESDISIKLCTNISTSIMWFDTKNELHLSKTFPSSNKMSMVIVSDVDLKNRCYEKYTTETKWAQDFGIS